MLLVLYIETPGFSSRVNCATQSGMPNIHGCQGVCRDETKGKTEEANVMCVIIEVIKHQSQLQTQIV
ncbi:hypothetical protein Hamer_G031031 [Homarus americanus]|uniref:Uncharacterized protein n=1 Tax=Homarus americanus TaxID=6706 RepID=A0A8J5K043_HOMAM|nr:hypothetical protein Hamer_G031031 [Homarus americanus]